MLNTLNLDFDTPLKEFPEEAMDNLFDGAGDQKFDVSYDFKNSNVTYKHKFAGIKSIINDQYEDSKSNKQRDKAKAYLSKVTCSTCGGGRLNREALSYKIDGLSIQD